MDTGHSSNGPLSGVRVIELAAIGPGPFAAMMLSDMGADVVRVDRLDSVLAGSTRPVSDVLSRGRRSIGVDLKHPAGVETVLRLADRADALIEGFRPGVTERLGVGPDVCLARNPRLVYGRMTGWGQEGPASSMAGHDINYIALSGALSLIGSAGGPPVPPVNLVGDYGGGGLLLAFGIACALWESARSGAGQVIDCAMVDGAATLAAVFFGMATAKEWSDQRGTNLLDGGAPFYNVFETADSRFLAVGSIEQQFYDEMVRLIGLDGDSLPDRMDRANWPKLKECFGAVFRTKTLAEWCVLLDGTDACCAPVLGLSEAGTHPHAKARNSFVEVDGVIQPGPAPRFSRTKPVIQRPPVKPGEHTEAILTECGLGTAEIADLRAAGAVA